MLLVTSDTTKQCLSASSVSWGGVGSAAPYNCERTPRQTKASVWCLSDSVANPHQAGEA